jgi:hydrogenase/urease accessory protein HupE
MVMAADIPAVVVSVKTEGAVLFICTSIEGEGVGVTTIELASEEEAIAIAVLDAVDEAMALVADSEGASSEPCKY